MLARKLLLSPGAGCATSLTRAFTTTSLSRIRAPALGDITHDSAEVFNAKQKEFREGLESAKKKKEQADSQLLTVDYAPSSISYPKSASSHGGEVLNAVGLG